MHQCPSRLLGNTVDQLVAFYSGSLMFCSTIEYSRPAIFVLYISWKPPNLLGKSFYYPIRCNITVILLEMDRILRPGGLAYIRDSKSIIEEIKEITEAMGWRAIVRDTPEGPYTSRKFLTCQKPLLS